MIEPSPHDANTAYLAVERHRLDDNKPYIYKTSEPAKPGPRSPMEFQMARMCTRCARIRSAKVCCMPARKRACYFSFDDGAHWQPLQLNLPMSPIHDLVVKDDDLVVATHGRSFWVLDNLTPLRQVNPGRRGRRRFSISRKQRCVCIILPNTISVGPLAKIRRPAQ